MRMISLKGVAIREFMRFRAGQVADFAAHAHRDQHQVLKDLVKKASGTEYGHHYGFSYIRDYDAYRKQVPLMDYEDMKPFFERTLKGEQNVFWPQPVYWFAKSSGTTSERSKYIPVSSDTLETAHYKGAFDVMSRYSQNRPDTKVFYGKTLIISGSQKIYGDNKRVRVGDISAIMVYNQPKLADFLRTPEKNITLREDFEEKLELASRLSIGELVTGMAGVPTWNIVLLKKILQQTSKSHIGEVWPEMELYIHGGVNFEPHRSVFEELIPLQQMQYLQVYNASEGFFAFQDRLGADDMLLATHHGIFYEFIPVEQYFDEQPEVLSLDEVETGRQYAIVITTNSGLWRYKIGDTVVFTSTKPYRLKVTGRTKFFLNAFGEEVMVENADTAIIEACRATGAQVKDYTACPVYFNGQGKGTHEWLIEFEQRPEDLDRFTTELDEALKRVNSDYEAKRSKDMALVQPVVRMAAPDTFYKWLKSKGKVGAQNKVPRLSNDRKIMEELLQIKQGG